MTEDEKQQAIDNVLKNEQFPLYYAESTSNKFPFFSHTIVGRHDHTKDSQKINSEIYYFFYNILERFCKKNNIELNYILRAAVNVTYSNSDFKIGEPHVDNEFPHKTFILYLNEFPEDSDYNSTIVYDVKYADNQYSVLDFNINDEKEVESDFNIIAEYPPKFGWALCFNGEHYHTIRWPKNPQLRYICVINFF
jgi:hypothetical protein